MAEGLDMVVLRALLQMAICTLGRGNFYGWLLGLETAVVANRFGGVTTEGIRDFGLGGNGSGDRCPSLITPDIFIITSARFGAHCVPPMRHLSTPSLQPTDVKLRLSHYEQDRTGV